ncbi:MAG TPA: hypothetical protein VHF06_01085 [Pseudonocardiaceae bacterium]|nr:hypothetical protein [Pseudonocardiaceae bacterium]
MTGQPTPTRGALRVLRGSVLAVTSAALAVVAHAVSGGMAPDTGLTALLTVGVAAVGVALADRRRSTGAILTVLAGAQLAMHVLLSVGSMGMPTHVNDLVMLGAHAGAVLVSALLLARADDAVFLLACVLAMLLPVLVAVPPAPSAPVRVRHRRTERVDRRAAVLLRRACARRGPPLAG